MLPSNPLVSVIIPCYNAGRYVKDAIDSITGQDYRNLEIIAIDDCSTDDTAKILEGLAENDERIRVVRNEKNLKLISTLNKGIDLASGEYLARMDADDISVKSRIGRQVELLQSQLAVGLTSVFAAYIDAKGNWHSRNTHFSCTSVFSSLFMALFESPILHAAVLGKTSLFKKYKYIEHSGHTHIEDYELWTRMLSDGVRFSGIPEYLYLYRRNYQSVTHLHNTAQITNHTLCSASFLKRLLGIVLPEHIHKVILTRSDFACSLRDISLAFRWLQEVKYSFLKKYNTEIDGSSLFEINQWVEQRKLKILLFYFLRGGLKGKFGAIYMMIKNIHLLLSLQSWKNIFSRIQWIIGSVRERYFNSR